MLTNNTTGSLESENELARLRKLVEDQAAAIAEKDKRIASYADVINKQRSTISSLKRNLDHIRDVLDSERIVNSQAVIRY